MENQPLDNPQPLSERDERMFATFAHLSLLAGFVIPLGNIIAPLVIWLTQRDKSAFVDAHAKEALNFQITLTILGAGGFLLTFILIGVPFLILIGLAALAFCIIGAMKANRGEEYVYPFNLRIIR
ncbi:MAG: DUF4870 domain-containing protein [Lewinellaceae bacterium]|nr:DUF4870 domain-containing protein [Lewinellaceae bacterium]